VAVDDELVRVLEDTVELVLEVDDELLVEVVSVVPLVVVLALLVDVLVADVLLAEVVVVPPLPVTIPEAYITPRPLVPT
jgi:hypothetical protein